ncbi:Phosphodiesterase/alkaline phosphatase D, partial [hydrothermal vent metagenome]
SSLSASPLKSGPMLGHTALRGVNIWLETKDPASIKIKYWQNGHKKDAKYQSATTNKDTYNMHTFKLSGLQPGLDYHYQIWVNKKPVQKRKETFSFKTQQLWMWRTDPPKFSVLTGSCNFGNEEAHDRAGTPYGGGYEIFDTLAKQDADMMLWLGDNWYYRDVDYDAEQNMIYRASKDKGRDFLQPVFQKFANYAIWDDHDFGADNSGGYFIHKQKSLDIFKNVWANPSYGMPATPGIFTKVRFNDVDFFLLDNRYHRSHEHFPDGPDKHMYGPEQILWLKNQLVASRQPFKIIVGGNQMLNDYHKWEGWDKYRYERDAFLNWVDETKIEGLVFLSGDKHHTEMLKIPRENAYPLYELTCSPFTAGTHEKWIDNERKKSTLIQETLVGEKNFCKLTFDGLRKDRNITFESYNVDGKLLWSKKLKQSVLTYSSSK